MRLWMVTALAASVMSAFATLATFVVFAAVVFAAVVFATLVIL